MRLRVRYINLAPRINGLLVSAARHLAGGARNSMSYCYCADFPASEHVFTYRPSCRKRRKNLAGIYLLNWLRFANICFWDAYKSGISIVSNFECLLNYYSLLINQDPFEYKWYFNKISSLISRTVIMKSLNYNTYHNLNITNIFKE